MSYVYFTSKETYLNLTFFPISQKSSPYEEWNTILTYYLPQIVL